MSLLSTRGLGKQYAGLHAVDNVDFDLPEGQIRAIIGPNGAGKTTFVGMLCGRISATTGSVRFRNQDITRMPASERMRLGMAYTFQITSVFSRLPVLENVSLAARRVHGNKRDKVTSVAMRALERVDLHERADQLAGDLSYGHQRLLEIAMGLAQTPSLFILDEPTQGLSEFEVESFKMLIRELSGEATILLIEHNMDVVMETADYITVLNYGETLANGTPNEIRANDAVQAAYLGTS